MPSATIKKTINHDKMVLKASFPSGATLKWQLTRDSEKLEVAFSNDELILKNQVKVIDTWLKSLKGTNTEKFDTLEALLIKCVSGATVIATMEKQLAEQN